MKLIMKREEPEALIELKQVGGSVFIHINGMAVIGFIKEGIVERLLLAEGKRGQLQRLGFKLDEHATRIPIL